VEGWRGGGVEGWRVEEMEGAEGWRGGGVEWRWSGGTDVESEGWSRVVSKYRNIGIS
jgi:hypothetical protein